MIFQFDEFPERKPGHLIDNRSSTQVMGALVNFQGRIYDAANSVWFYGAGSIVQSWHFSPLGFEYQAT
jgi:hypothetical protein